jgi:two-component sensor histidine kinase
MKLTPNSLHRVSGGSARREPHEASAATIFAVEAHHRIGNNLGMIAAMLRMHSDAVRRGESMLSPEEVGDIIDLASARVDVAAQLHRLLATSNHGTVKLGDYLQRIAESAMNAITHAHDTELVFTFDGEHPLDSKTAVRIGFIVNEVVTNSFKYSHPARGVRGRLELSCAKLADGGLMIRIADDGVGFPEGFDPDRDGGLGMRTIARQMDAGLAFDSSDLGLEVSLSLPPAPPRLG